MFQARKPMLRHAKKVLEISKEAQKVTETVRPPPNIIYLSSPAKEETVIKQRKGKEKIFEKIEIEVLKEQLKLANDEIVVLKKEARKHNVQKV